MTIARFPTFYLKNVTGRLLLKTMGVTSLFARREDSISSKIIHLKQFSYTSIQIFKTHVHVQSLLGTPFF